VCSSAARASAASTVACGPEWSTVPSVTTLQDPRGIGVVAPDDIWIVGTQAVPVAKVHTAAEHWDGAEWTLVPTVDPGLGENALNGVAVVATDDVWAVGFMQPQKKTSNAFRTLIEHWDGTQWSVVPSPSVGDGSNTLTGVSALSAHNIWAVGYYFSGNAHVRSTLVEHYDGSDWTVVPSPNPGGTSDSLIDVTAISATNVWAAGFSDAGLGYGALLEHWDGASWTPVAPAADPGVKEAVFTGISARGGKNIWAVGYHVVGSQYATLTEHWDGSSWSLVPSPDGPDQIVTVLRGGATSAGQAWAVGFDYHLNAGRYKAFTEHWDGTAWTRYTADIAKTPDKSELYTVRFVPGTDQVWSAGRRADVETICLGSRSSPAPAGGSDRAIRPPDEGSGAGSSPAGFATRPGAPGRIPGVVHSTAGRGPAIAVRAQDVTDQAGLTLTTLSHGAAIADYNNDGWDDIFLSRDENPNNLYLNNRDGTFTQVNKDEFPKRDHHGCAAADVNRDGLLDIFCNTGSARGTEGKRDELWIQQNDGTFIDQAAQYGILMPFDRGRNSAFVDANGDGYPDVFATNFPDRADGMPSSNRLFLDDGGSRFLLAPKYGLDLEINGGSISVGDYNNDGWADILISGQAGVKLFRNDLGTGFTDVTASVGLARGANFVQFTDLNDDGKLDVALVTNTRLTVFLQSGGTFHLKDSEVIDSGHAVTAGDVNKDGYPDLYVLQAGTDASGNAPDLVFLNDGTGTGFTPMTVPSTDKGSAEAVTPIDYDKNGLTDFLVENGNAGQKGPVQLVAFFPA
jgi:hypothetical protein